MPQLDIDLERKIIDGLKGVLNTLRLVPFGETLEAENYQRTLQLFQCKDGELSELWVKRRDTERMQLLVEKRFPGKTDRKLVHKLLLKTAKEWIEAGHQISEQAELKRLGIQFIAAVESEINDWVVYLPVQGLEGSLPGDISLGACQLFQNTIGGELDLAIRGIEEYVDVGGTAEALTMNDLSRTAPFFFRVCVTAHTGRAVQNARGEAGLALSVLRLFVASYYRDRHLQGLPRDMGLAGTIPRGESSPALYLRDNIPLDKQYAGVQTEGRGSFAYEVDFPGFVRANGSRLAQINAQIISSRRGIATSLGRRLELAITWFAKGTSASSIAESFLMYAIAIEALLSQGRTSQHEYALRIAALVLRCGEDQNPFAPYGGLVSSQLHDRLLGHTDLSIRFDKLVERIDSLFDYRNQIAHGRMSEDELDAMELVDFETLVRCSLISFVDGGWRSVDEFAHWLGASLGHRFTPQKAPGVRTSMASENEKSI
ncbi:MAG: hypothetical protein GX552_07730 [Chloroflexi bacterium]|nr:hypothetical protein [Chloroflexota bacterium]